LDIGDGTDDQWEKREREDAGRVARRVEQRRNFVVHGQKESGRMCLAAGGVE
jgi:hypothetical protein